MLLLSRLLFVAALLLPVSIAAHAQTGVYVAFSAAKPNVTPRDWIYGPTVGLYLDHGHLLFFSTGVDIRGSFIGSSDTTQLYSGLVGPRVVVRPHVVPLMPYVEALGGVGRLTYNSASRGYGQTTRFEYQFLGGVDFTILPHLDWRVAEFSYGGLSAFGTSFNPKTISTGIVLRLPGL